MLEDLTENRFFWIIAGAVMVLVIFLILITIPPRSLMISTGSTAGVYFRTGEQYAELLAESDVNTTVLPGEGSVQTLERLVSGEANVGFVQGGTADDYQEAGLLSLGSLYHEPIWVFHRADLELNFLHELRDARIAIGQAGSGVYPVALQLLSDNDLLPDAGFTPVNASSSEAAGMLLNGDIDAAFFVISAESELIDMLMRDETVSLMDFSRSEAYAARHREYTTVTLYEGLIDLIDNIPSQDISLLSVTANLVVRSDVHPSLVRLLSRVTDEVHSPGGLLEAPDEYPSAAYTELPVHDEARRYYDEGANWFDQNLPFVLAAVINRWFFTLVGLFTVFTVLRGVIPLYSMNIRRKITRWYPIIKNVDRDVLSMSPEQLAAAREHLETILNDITTQVNVPAGFLDDLYRLKDHTLQVLERIEEREASMNNPPHVAG